MSMRQKSEKHHLTGLIALILFGVFASCILSVLLTGSGAYKRLTERDREAFGTRTCLQYIATKVRQAPCGADIYVEEMDGVSAVCIPEDIGGRIYVTRIYSYDGWLREIFASAGNESHPEDGEKIIKAETVEFALEDGLLSATLYENGDPIALTISLRGEGDGI